MAKEMEGPGTVDGPTSNPVQRGAQTDEAIFPFLNLPLELRLEIYHYLLRIPEPIGVAIDEWLCTRGGKFAYPSILLANRQIHAESREVLYGRNSFILYIEYIGGSHNDIFTTFLSFNGLQEAKKRHMPLHEIRSLRLFIAGGDRYATDVLRPHISCQVSFIRQEMIHLKELNATLVGRSEGECQFLQPLAILRGIPRVRIAGAPQQFADHLENIIMGDSPVIPSPRSLKVLQAFARNTGYLRCGRFLTAAKEAMEDGNVHEFDKAKRAIIEFKTYKSLDSGAGYRFLDPDYHGEYTALVDEAKRTLEAIGEAK